jgi:hypothetical protein
MSDKYRAYLEDSESENKLLREMFEQVSDREFELAFGTAMRIKAIKDIKWDMLKIDEQNKQPIH